VQRDLVLRANPEDSLGASKDVARMGIGAQDYEFMGRLNGKAAAILALYQLPWLQRH